MCRSVEFRPPTSDPFRAADGRWLFKGEEVRLTSGELIIFSYDLQYYKATDLQAALRRARELYGQKLHPIPVRVVETVNDMYDEDTTAPELTSFELLDDGALTLSLVFGFDVEDLEAADRDPPQVIRSVLESLLRRHRMTIVKHESGKAYPPETFISVEVWIGFNPRGRTLRELYDIGEDAYALFDAMDGGQLTRQTAGDLIRGGQAEVLIGQSEGHWLDVKREHYDLSTDAGKIKLAQSVSRFCNAEEGGLVVVGMSTKRVPGGEDIRGLCPVPHDKGMLRRYQYALEKCLFPPPDHLSIEAVEIADDGMLILIDVPPQPEELKPFLVHGAVVNGKVEGAFISIVRRRGESSIPITAQAIHSTLAAGRALLRRGELPPQS
jgi:hypothetical protein